MMTLGVNVGHVHELTMLYCGVTGALAWNADVLSSGSRDRLILQKDIRTPSLVPERKLTGHRQEVGWVVSQVSLSDQGSLIRPA